MPDVCPELVFHFKGQFDEVSGNLKLQKSFTAGVHAQTSQRKEFYIDTAFGIFGVCLYPFAIPFIFKLPTSELTNEMPDLSALLKSQGNELEEKVANACDHYERKKIVEEFILAKLSDNYQTELPVFSAIRNLATDHRVSSIKKIAGEYYLSQRQFERNFLQYSGFTPKLFLRISRFHFAMSRYGTGERSLTRMALDCGYYDQSHFIHDFKEFSGFNPRHYFSGTTGATAWRD